MQREGEYKKWVRKEIKMRIGKYEVNWGQIAIVVVMLVFLVALIIRGCS